MYVYARVSPLTQRWIIHLQGRRHRKWGFDPWKIPWRRKCQPTPVFLPENSTDKGAWWTIVHGSQRVGHDWAPVGLCIWKYNYARPFLSLSVCLEDEVHSGSSSADQHHSLLSGFLSACTALFRQREKPAPCFLILPLCVTSHAPVATTASSILWVAFSPHQGSSTLPGASIQRTMPSPLSQAPASCGRPFPPPLGGHHPPHSTQTSSSPARCPAPQMESFFPHLWLQLHEQGHLLNSLWTHSLRRTSFHSTPNLWSINETTGNHLL